MDKIKFAPSIILKYAIIIILIIVAFIRLSEGVSLKNYPAGGYDEQMWTGASITSYYMYFKDYNRKRIIPERWFQSYAKKYNYNYSRIPRSELQWFDDDMWTFGWKAPNIAKFIMGFAIVNFGSDVDPGGYFYRYNPDKTKNKWPGNYAPAEFVKLARTANAFLTFGTILLFLFIGWEFFNFWVGAAAAGFAIGSTSFIRVCTAAGVDGASVFFTTLTIFFALKFINYIHIPNNRKKLLLFSVFIGISFPLAVGSKLIAALNGYVFIIFLAAVLFALFKSTKKSNYKKTKNYIAATKNRNELLKTLAISGIIIGALTFVIFVYSNPVMYDEPMLKVRMIRESVKEFFDIRARALGTSDINGDWFISLWFIIKRIMIRIDDKFFSVFGNLINIKYNFLDGFFFFVGFWIMLKKGFYEFKLSLRANKELYFVIWILVYIWGIADFIWTDFTRYYMPLFPIFSLMVGTGIVETIKLIKTKITDN